MDHTQCWFQSWALGRIAASLCWIPVQRCILAISPFSSMKFKSRKRAAEVQSQRLLCDRRAFSLLDKQVCCVTPLILQTHFGSGTLLFCLQPLWELQCVTAGRALHLILCLCISFFLKSEKPERHHPAHGSFCSSLGQVTPHTSEPLLLWWGSASRTWCWNEFLTYRCFQSFVFINRIIQSLRVEKPSNIESNHSPSSAWALQLFTAVTTSVQFAVLLSFAMISSPWAASMSPDTQILKVAECWTNLLLLDLIPVPMFKYCPRTWAAVPTTDQPALVLL